MGERSTWQHKGKWSPSDLIVPAARRNEYSVREIRQSTRAIGAALDPLTEREQREFKDQLPRGLLGGFEAVLKIADEAVNRLAGNHHKRRELLAALEALPFTSHQELLALSMERLRRMTPKDLASLRSADVHLSSTEKQAIAEGAEAALLLVKFLAILAFAARRRFPSSLPLFLLFLLIGTSVAAARATARPVPAPAPVCVTRPPGQLVLAEPRVARAPGHLASLAANRSEGRAGLGAPWGSALLT